MRVENWTSRVVVNALIGFSRADPVWPNPLGECGWRVSTVEPDWLVDVPGTQQPGRIRPDVVFALRAGEELLLFECKVGTVQTDQLARYQLVTVNRIRDQTPERPVNAVQVAYAGTEPHRLSCEQSLAGTGVPLLTFSNDEAILSLGNLNEPCADARFQAGIPLTGLRPPTQYIPLDADSPLEESIPVVLRALMSLALDGTYQFDVRTVVERVFGDMFQALSPSFRNDLRPPVERALTRLSGHAAIGDVLSRNGATWSLRPDFGQQGGLQFRTAARRITEHLTALVQQQALDV
jgi:hypothetical protein